MFGGCARQIPFEAIDPLRSWHDLLVLDRGDTAT
jgi:hypothetical protein